MVERAALEMRYTRKRIEGSNPPLSAKEIKLSVQVYLSKQIFLYIVRMPSADFRDYVEIPHFWMPSADLRDYVAIYILSFLKCTIGIENHNLLDGSRRRGDVGYW